MKHLTDGLLIALMAYCLAIVLIHVPHDQADLDNHNRWLQMIQTTRRIETKMDYYDQLNEARAQSILEEKENIIYAKVTGYNTVESQTDSSPCYAGGTYICGRTDVVACPSILPKGTRIRIEERTYVCLDRTAVRFGDRFDISCDKDFACPYKVTGWKEVTILN